MKILLIGIAGTPNDFLLSLHVLKSFLCQYEDIKRDTEIILKQFYYIPATELKEGAERILEDIKGVGPDIVGFSCYTWNIDAVKIIADKIKQKDKEIKVVFGGPEIASADVRSGRFDEFAVDFFVFGEGEKPLTALTRCLLKNDMKAMEGIKKGLAYKKGGSFVCKNEFDLIERLDEMPSPYLNGYVSDDILSRPDIRVNIETQRGCNFRCAYCLYHKNFPNIRYRDPDMVVDEIDYAYKKGIKIGRIVDANFISDRAFAKKIMKGLIKRKIAISIFLEILPHFLDEEIAGLFGEYTRISPQNKLMVGMGIQTLTQEALAVIKRKIPVRFFDNAFNLLQKQKVIIKSDIILGLPRETKESYFKTMEYIIEKMVQGTNHLALAPLRILPGSEMVEIAKDEKIVIDKRDTANIVYSTPTMPREDMIECLRLNTATIRLLNSMDIEERMLVRDMYFEVKRLRKFTNIELLQYFSREFYEFLKGKDSDYVRPDFPGAETYSIKTVYDDISDEWLIEKLSSLKGKGIV